MPLSICRDPLKLGRWTRQDIISKGTDKDEYIVHDTKLRGEILAELIGHIARSLDALMGKPSFSTISFSLCDLGLATEYLRVGVLLLVGVMIPEPVKHR